MAITNAQQYQQLVNKPASGKRPGYRGDGGYQGGSGAPGSAESKGMGGDGGYNDGTPDVDYGRAQQQFQDKLAADNARRAEEKRARRGVRRRAQVTKYRPRLGLSRTQSSGSLTDCLPTEFFLNFFPCCGNKLEQGRIVLSVAPATH